MKSKFGSSKVSSSFGGGAKISRSFGGGSKISRGGGGGGFFKPKAGGGFGSRRSDNLTPPLPKRYRDDLGVSGMEEGRFGSRRRIEYRDDFYDEYGHFRPRFGRVGGKLLIGIIFLIFFLYVATS